MSYNRKTVILSVGIAGILFEGVIALNLLHSFAKKAWQTMSALHEAPFIDIIADHDVDSDEESD